MLPTVSTLPVAACLSLVTSATWGRAQSSSAGSMFLLAHSSASSSFQLSRTTSTTSSLLSAMFAKLRKPLIKLSSAIWCIGLMVTLGRWYERRGTAMVWNSIAGSPNYATRQLEAGIGPIRRTFIIPVRPRPQRPCLAK